MVNVFFSLIKTVNNDLQKKHFHCIHLKSFFPVLKNMQQFQTGGGLKCSVHLFHFAG